MRILLHAHHVYPANLGGPGGGRVFDWLAAGLAELGHEVIYYLEQDPIAPMPAGVTHTKQPCWDADIYHIRSDSTFANELIRRQLPWVATCHTDPAVWQRPRNVARDNWIFVSQNLAKTLNSQRYVSNGIDPAELNYSDDKEDYLLFAATLRLADRKGLAEAIDIARACGKQLYVAGSDADPQLVERVKQQTEQAGMRYLGEISGEYKAQIFAKASAFLFPTQINEAFGLVMAEAMMSGTPVICSSQGACREVVSAEVGFICDSQQDYLQAITRLDEISPQDCRKRAMSRFHYLQMAKDYVQQYQQEINQQELNKEH
ncbi:MAG: glycosyltransferase involved in cell wall biosynthesis [Phenylobacterium sp.]|jgi:glycosyltransferase involved in cell wall biosynthesis